MFMYMHANILDNLDVYKSIPIKFLYYHTTKIILVPEEKHFTTCRQFVKKACKQANVSEDRTHQTGCVCMCVCVWLVKGYLLVTGVSVSLWNCLCCVGCCHCWRTGWTSISSALSVTQAWTAAFGAVLSSSPLNLYRGLILILVPSCCRHRSTRVWLQLHWLHRPFRCTYLTWACLRRHWESRFCPFWHCCLWGLRAPTGTQTEAELDRDKKKPIMLKQKKGCKHSPRLTFYNPQLSAK